VLVPKKNKTLVATSRPIALPSGSSAFNIPSDIKDKEQMINNSSTLGSTFS
jgi:hypothetical protein